MSDQRILDIENEIDNTKGIIQNSFGLVIDRGEKLEDLVDKSENLSHRALIFNTQSKRLKRKMCIKKLKMTVLLIFIILLIILVICLFACGIKLNHC